MVELTYSKRDRDVPGRIGRYLASAPNARYAGRSLKAIAGSLRADVLHAVLNKYGIAEIDAEGWMEAQLHLDILREIEAQSSWAELVTICMKAGEQFDIPPSIDSIERFLLAIPQLYQMEVQDVSPSERISVEKIGVRYYQVTYHVPLPLFVMYGITYAILKRLQRKNQNLRVFIFDDGTPYIFDVKW